MAGAVFHSHITSPEYKAASFPASRRDVFEKLRGPASPTCAFVNLPDKRPSRWGDALTADKMKKCVWLRPERVAQVEFLEWTSGSSPARTVCRAQGGQGTEGGSEGACGASPKKSPGTFCRFRNPRQERLGRKAACLDQSGKSNVQLAGASFQA